DSAASPAGPVCGHKRPMELAMTPASTMLISTFVNFRVAIAAAVAVGGLATETSNAEAVSRAVKFACMADYFAYCSSYEVGSTALRQCMRNAGSKLSSRCVNALVAAGEVSKAEVNRRKSRAAQAQVD